MDVFSLISRNISANLNKSAVSDLAVHLVVAILNTNTIPDHTVVLDNAVTAGQVRSLHNPWENPTFVSMLVHSTRIRLLEMVIKQLNTVITLSANQYNILFSVVVQATEGAEEDVVRRLTCFTTKGLTTKDRFQS